MSDNSAPERIWLQQDPESECNGSFPPPDSWEYVTWSGGKVFDLDVEYIRADLVQAKDAEIEGENKRLRAELAAMTQQRDTAMAGTSFQARVQPWMMACFGPAVSADRMERGDRLLEEVFELLQSGGYPKDRTASLAAYVWSRDVGDPAQEVGGVMVTLAAYCLAHDLDMHDAGETELARVWTKVEAIRAKQAGKPKGSALPQEWPDPDRLLATTAAARDAQMRAEGRVAGLREAYEDFAQEQDRQAEKWQKEANRHRRSDGHRSECEDRDLARRDSCIKRAAEIRALADKIEGDTAKARDEVIMAALSAPTDQERGG